MATVYATWNPADIWSGASLSNGNLTLTNTIDTAWAGGRSTISKSNGKWYWEYTFTSSSNFLMSGIARSTAGTNFIGADIDGWSYYGFNGRKYNDGTSTAYGVSYGNGTVIGIALDMDAGTITMYKDNVSQGTMFSGVTGNIFAGVSVYSLNAYCVANFGATALTYTPPTGFNAGLYDEILSLSVFDSIAISENISFPLTKNLVAYWKLDENSNDAVGSNNGTDTSITYSAGNGKIGQGAGFDSSSDKIVLPNLGVGGATARTISLWANATSFSGVGQMFGYGTGGTNAFCLLSNQYSGRIYWQFAANDYYTGDIMSTGTWYHIVAVYDGGTLSTSTVHLYLNGVPQNISGSGTGSANTTDSNYAIGYDVANSAGSFPGAIDEVGIWNRALSAEEITTLYNSGAGLSYPFESIPSTSTFDSVATSENINLFIPTLFLSISETTTITENIQMGFASTISIFDSITVSENTSLLIPILFIDIYNDIVTSELSSLAGTGLIIEVISVTEYISILITTLYATISELVTTTEGVTLGTITTLILIISENITISSVFSSDLPVYSPERPQFAPRGSTHGNTGFLMGGGL